MVIRALGLAALLCAAGAVRAGAPTEYEVKAAFLYNFARFVEWPAESRPPGATFVVAVLGQDPFGPALDEVFRNKSVDGRRVEVRRVSRALDAAQSQILFVSSSEKERLPAILQGLREKPVLTVGEDAAFTELGGIVRLHSAQERVRLQINLAAASRGKLRISSQLLRIADVVGREG